MGRQCVSPSVKARADLKRIGGAGDAEENDGHDEEWQGGLRQDGSGTVEDAVVDVHEQPEQHPGQDELAAVDGPVLSECPDVSCHHQGAEKSEDQRHGQSDESAYFGRERGIQSKSLRDAIQC